MVDGKASAQFKGTKRRGEMLRLDEIEIPAVTTPRFSPDSRHVAYAVYEDGHWSTRLDGQPLGRKFEKIVPGGPCFREDGTLEFLGIVEGSIYRLAASLGKTGQEH